MHASKDAFFVDSVVYNQRGYFYMRIKKQDTYFVIKTKSDQNKAEIMQTTDRNIAKEYHKQQITRALERGEKLTPLDL